MVGYLSIREYLRCSTHVASSKTGETIQEILQGENFPYKGQIKIIGDKLSIKSDIMKAIFQTVTREIVDHISNVFTDSKAKGCSLMLLVGGFSESEIVQNAIRQKFEKEERKIIVPAEAGLSVVKGAAIAGHALNIVTNRVVRYNYGIAGRKIFDATKHPEKYKVVDGANVYAKDNFVVLMKMNTSVEEGTVIEDKWCFNSFNTNSGVSVYAASKDVKFVDENGCKLLCEIIIWSNELKEYLGKLLNITINFIFGRTELAITVDITETGTRFTASVEI